MQAFFAAYPSPATPSSAATLPNVLQTLSSTTAQRTITVQLRGDGRALPALSDYEGTGDPTDIVPSPKTGLVQFEDIEDISIVAAPGSTYQMDLGGPVPWPTESRSG